MSHYSTFKIHIAQISTVIGDFSGNSDIIFAGLNQASDNGADLVIFPELAICGYPAGDWLLQEDFIRQSKQSLESLAIKSAALPPFIIGVPWQQNGKLYNSAVLVQDGKIFAVTTKQALPSFGVFDEARYFVSDLLPQTFTVNNVRIACVLCQDFWQPEIMQIYQNCDPDIYVIINASPFEIGKYQKRLALAKNCNKPVFYINSVGGQDGLVFDGRSFAYDNGKAIVLSHCTPDSRTISLRDLSVSDSNADIDEQEEVYAVLTRGLSDYFRHSRCNGVLIGLSGGIDSALTAAIAVDALGADRVCGVHMPSQYTSEDSMNDAADLAKKLGIKMLTIPINEAMVAMNDLLNNPNGLAQENMQARLRGVILMTLSNQNNYLVLTTGNKSEMAVGYATLYGDMCGGFSVLKDIYKTDVYRLAHFRNRQNMVFNDSVLTKEPTAELRPDQKDSDSLPLYPILDKLLRHFIEEYGSKQQAINDGIDPAIVNRVYDLLYKSEYKRKQSPIGVKVTTRAFGHDWRVPVMGRGG